MNKFMAYAVVLAFGGIFSGAALSATVWGDTSQTQEVTGGPTGNCPLLADTVTLGVSSNVIGGYACDETNNIIQVAACHQGGSRAAGAACNDISADTTDGNPEYPEGCDGPGGNSTIPSFLAFMASSNGGVMAEVPLAQRCTQQQLGGIAEWVN